MRDGDVRGEAKATARYKPLAKRSVVRVHLGLPLKRFAFQMQNSECEMQNECSDNVNKRKRAFAEKTCLRGIRY